MGVLKIHKYVEIVQQSRQIVEVGVGVGRFFVDLQHPHIFQPGVTSGSWIGWIGWAYQVYLKSPENA